MAFKALIFLGLLAITLGFTLPEDHLDSPYANSVAFQEDEYPVADDLVLVRRARSPLPQGRINLDYRGNVADVRYTHPLSDNFELYGGASRDYNQNDNKGYIGGSWSF